MKENIPFQPIKNVLHSIEYSLDYKTGYIKGFSEACDIFNEIINSWKR